MLESIKIMSYLIKIRTSLGKISVKFLRTLIDFSHNFKIGQHKEGIIETSE